MSNDPDRPANGDVLVQLHVVKRRTGRPPGGKFKVPSDGLFLGSLPIECATLSLSEVEYGGKRNVLCRRYGNCVTYAASRAWRGFSCEACDVEEPMTIAEQARDLDGLIMFLHALNLARGG